MADKRSYPVVRIERGHSYTLFVLAAIVTAFLALVAPLWVSVIYGGFLFCLLLSKKGVSV